MAEISANKRIAKNTLMLYFRQILIMGVSLYTVRVVLNVLGAEDYGIYNVVAGVVTMFSFLSGSLSSASQRFLSFELSGKENNRYTEIFTTMIFIYLFFGIVIFILLESVGLWLINNKLIIPIERIETSRKVFHLSIVSFFFTMFVSPYTASIVAHEDMTVYALFSVIETFLRLFLAILVQFINADKLFLYALLMLFVTIINSSMYILFAHFKYKSCRIVRYWNKNLFNELLSFLGWNLIGSFVSVLKNYGINIILNMFYGPIINASRAIAYQIKSASSSFAMNITTAIRPQITINYANSNNNKMYNLAFLSAKYSFYLVLLISLPIIFLINPILTLWLKNIPAYAVNFTILVLIANLIEVLSYPLITVAMATGRIKGYEIVIGIIGLLNIIISYLLLKIGFGFYSVFVLNIIVEIVLLTARLLIIKQLVYYSSKYFIMEVLIPILITTLAASLFSFFLIKFIPDYPYQNVIYFLSVIFITLLSIAIFGLNKSDYNQIKKIFRSRNAKY